MNYAKVRPIGRILRVVFGTALLWLLWTGNSALATQPLNVAGYLLGVVVTYAAVTIALGKRILVKSIHGSGLQFWPFLSILL